MKKEIMPTHIGMRIDFIEFWLELFTISIKPKELSSVIFVVMESQWAKNNQWCYKK